MSSIVTNLNSLTVIGSTAQEIVNWVTTADFAVGKFVHTRRNCRHVVANCVHTADATQLDSCIASSSYCALTIALWCRLMIKVVGLLLAGSTFVTVA